MPCIEYRVIYVMMMWLASGITVGTDVDRIRTTVRKTMMIIVHLIVQLWYHNILPFGMAFVRRCRRMKLRCNIVVVVVCLNSKFRHVISVLSDSTWTGRGLGACGGYSPISRSVPFPSWCSAFGKTIDIRELVHSFVRPTIYCTDHDSYSTLAVNEDVKCYFDETIRLKNEILIIY